MISCVLLFNVLPEVGGCYAASSFDFDPPPPTTSCLRLRYCADTRHVEAGWAVGLLVDGELALVVGGVTNRLRSWASTFSAQMAHAANLGGLSVPPGWSMAAQGLNRAAPRLPENSVGTGPRLLGTYGGVLSWRPTRWRLSRWTDVQGNLLAQRFLAKCKLHQTRRPDRQRSPPPTG